MCTQHARGGNKIAVTVHSGDIRQSNKAFAQEHCMPGASRAAERKHLMASNAAIWLRRCSVAIVHSDCTDLHAERLWQRGRLSG